MSEQLPTQTETISRHRHLGVNFILSIERHDDGRWDTWVRFEDSAPNDFGNVIGLFVDRDDARREGLAKARELIETKQARRRPTLTG